MSIPKLPTLSPEQQAICDRVQRGENVLITGSAGTGKSRVLKELSRLYGDGLAVCGSTGIAAVQVGGMTLHSWGGLGLADKPAGTIADDILMRGGKTLNRIRNAKRLALDEVSMIHADVFQTVDQVFQKLRDNPLPFGGLQLILFGDFLQLPPVSRGKPTAFAFEAPAWAEARIKTGMLTEVFRQKDQAFSSMLNNVRVGDVTKEVGAMLGSRLKVTDPHPKTKPVIVYSHNADVDRENEERLKTMVGKMEEYQATDEPKEGSAQLTTLQKHCLAPEVLRLRKGAQVMLLWNVAPEEGLANGSIGVVEDFGLNRAPIVRFPNGERWESERCAWTIKDGDKVLAQRKQHPLRLAWAITAHKSQGMTLDKIQVHLHRVFEYGQAYVALSRARTLDGLFIESSKAGCIKAHPSAVEFYRTATL